MSKLKTVEARLNVFIKFLGLIFIAIGLFLASATATTPLLPQLSPIFYFISLLFIAVGCLVVVAELK